MGDWNSLEQILQDLSMAQGYVVPARLETVSADRPPAFNIEEEETEEQSYYESQGGGGDCPKPDYKLIQQMLHIVKEKKDFLKVDDLALSSDPDLQTPESVPQHIQKKFKRNVALSSIINDASLSARKLNPDNVIPTMFKKKSSYHPEEKSKKVPPVPQILSPEKTREYKPSNHATTYYTKYLERNKLKEQLAEDVWTRAEREMKEIEAKKKLKTELVSPTDRGNMSTLGTAYAAFDVNLPEHRHMLPGDCIVCIVAAKHGYYF